MFICCRYYDWFLPSAHKTPIIPAGHEHRKESSSSTHVPFCIHGLLSHSSTSKDSTKRKNECMLMIFGQPSHTCKGTMATLTTWLHIPVLFAKHISSIVERHLFSLGVRLKGTVTLSTTYLLKLTFWKYIQRYTQITVYQTAPIYNIFLLFDKVLRQKGNHEHEK